ncbi:MAG: helix-turn-helix transcriptional regulator [bacterium]|nr:helix-turn-helix transcriptional regulator [Candidatus Kapabacteria bacterium]
MKQVERLRSTVELQQQEIAVLELALAERNELLRETRQQATSILDECDESTRPRAQKLVELIEASTLPSTPRLTLDEWLDQTKHSFIRRLSERFPALTPTELKICSLLKLSMRTREIANLLQTSVRNIESHRYWIRKKLLLPTSTNLSTFLTAV